jgi:hypothetical protein
MSKVVSERGTGGATFAAVVMIIGGIFGFFEGLSLIVGGTFYVQPANYWISTGAATWGWWHLIVGLIVLAAGFGVISGAAWARWLGIIFVSIQAVTNFLFIPAQPFGRSPLSSSTCGSSIPCSFTGVSPSNPRGVGSNYGPATDCAGRTQHASTVNRYHTS